MTKRNHMSRSALRRAGSIALALTLVFAFRLDAQATGSCRTDRTVSTLVGSGLGLAAAAIPATVIHRHDQTSSHRIVIGSAAAGAVIGFVAAGRDRPCNSSDESSVGRPIVTERSTRAGRGILVGGAIGGVLGAVGSTFFHTGCTREPCHERLNMALFLAGEGAAAGGILGGLLGWAWPVRR